MGVLSDNVLVIIFAKKINNLRRQIFLTNRNYFFNIRDLFFCGAPSFLHCLTFADISKHLPEQCLSCLSCSLEILPGSYFCPFYVLIWLNELKSHVCKLNFYLLRIHDKWQKKGDTFRPTIHTNDSLRNIRS